MKEKNLLLGYNIEERLYALYLDSVSRVIRAVEVTPLPECPDFIAGIINFHGLIIPVINMRIKLQLPARETDPSDQFIIAATSRRQVALIVDSVAGIVHCPEDVVVKTQQILPEQYSDEQCVTGAIRLPDGIILIHNLDRFLSFDEEDKLDRALKEQSL